MPFPAAILFSLDAHAAPVRLALGLHIAAGTVALLAGLVLTLGRKGGPRHARLGRLYTACMMVVAGTATALCLLQPLTGGRLFLTGIAGFSFYLAFSGWRAARRRTAVPTRADRFVALGTLCVGLAMVGIGIGYQALLFAFFGGLTSFFAGHDVRAAYRPTAKPEPWLLRHIARMGGSYISAVTAFVVVNFGRWLPVDAPSWAHMAGWIGPTVVGSVLIGRAIRAYQPKKATNRQVQLS